MVQYLRHAFAACKRGREERRALRFLSAFLLLVLEPTAATRARGRVYLVDTEEGSPRLSTPGRFSRSLV